MSFSGEDTQFLAGLGLPYNEKRINVDDTRHNVVHNDTENIPPNGNMRLVTLEHEAHKIMQPPGRSSPNRRIHAESLSDYSMVGYLRSDIDSSVLSSKYSSGLQDNRGNMLPAKSTDLELATALGHKMVVEVRRLQAELSEKDEVLQQLHHVAKTSEALKKEFEVKIKAAADDEENLKNANWELEIRLQNSEEAQATSSEMKSRLEVDNARLLNANSELHNNLESLQCTLESLQMDLKTSASNHTNGLHDQKVIQESLRDENRFLQSKIELLEADVRKQATGLAAASVAPAKSENTVDMSDTESEVSSPGCTAPVSPIKGTPYRNVNLESETMKGTLNHHQMKMLRQRKELEREKRLRLQVQLELRDKETELDSLQQFLGSQPSRKRVTRPAEVSVKRHARTSKPGDTLETAQLNNIGEWEVVADQSDLSLMCDQNQTFPHRSHSSSPKMSSCSRTYQEDTWLSDVDLPSHNLSEGIDELAFAAVGVPCESSLDGDSSRRSSGTIAQALALDDELQCLSGDHIPDSITPKISGSTLQNKIHVQDAAMRRSRDSIAVHEGDLRHTSKSAPSFRNVGTQTSILVASILSLHDTKESTGADSSALGDAELISIPRYKLDNPELLSEPSNSPFATLARDIQPVMEDDQLQPVNQVSVVKSRWLELVANETELIASRIAIKNLVESNAAMSRSFVETGKIDHAHENPDRTTITMEGSEKRHDSSTQLNICPLPSTTTAPIVPQAQTTDSFAARCIALSMAPPEAPSTARDTLRGRQALSSSADGQPGMSNMQQSLSGRDNIEDDHKQDRSTTSSVLSFVSEIEQRFHAPMNTTRISSPAEAAHSRIIDSITKTMIGMSMYKYTRKAGRQNLSSNRHKRYFWLHPYTKTLYWSIYNPVSAPDGAIIKSAVILSVYIEDDFNPLPPGLHQKSICIETPQRMLKLTTVHSIEHEVWVQALRFLLDGPVINTGVREAQSIHSCPSVTVQPNSSLVTHNESTLAGLKTRNSLLRSRVSSIASGDDTQESRQSLPRIFTAEALAPLSSKISLDDVAGIDGLENVRACCGGRHNVGNLCARSTRSRSSSRVRSHI